jgi:hypothetical protein
LVNWRKEWEEVVSEVWHGCCLKPGVGCRLHCAALPWCGFGAVFLRRVLFDEAAATQSGEMVLGTRNAWLNCA